MADRQIASQVAPHVERHIDGSVAIPALRHFSAGADLDATPAIADVGLELDHKLAALLEHLGGPVPPTLTDQNGR